MNAWGRIGLVAVTALVAAAGFLAGHVNKPAGKCDTFNRDTRALHTQIVGRDYYLHSHIGVISPDPTIIGLRRAYALYYAQDTTGCASPLDKARARADLGWP